MSRSAYLPDRAKLESLLAGLRAKPAAANGRATAGWAPPVDSVFPSPPPTRPSGAPERPVTEPPQKTEALLAEFERVLSEARTLDQRFGLLVRWLEASVPAKQAFVADGDGLAMVESTVKEGYLAVAGELGSAFSQLAATVPDFEEGSTTLRLRGSGNVELVGCKTELGRFNVGLVLERPLGSDWISIIRAALNRVAQATREPG